jgi:uncharacterized membrane protein HdeD (DUF308 family)
MRVRLEPWDRFVAAVCTMVAGFLSAGSPSPSINALLGGFPATFVLGMVLGVGGFINLIGLFRARFTMQRVGLLMQAFALMLFALALLVVSVGGITLALILVALVARIFAQYRILGTARAIQVAVAVDEP